MEDYYRDVLVSEIARDRVGHFLRSTPLRLGFDWPMDRHPCLRVAPIGETDRPLGSQISGSRRWMRSGLRFGISRAPWISVLRIDRSRVSISRAVERYGTPAAVAHNLQLPLADAVFDVVISDGVIHHTESPESAFSVNLRVSNRAGSCIWP